MKITTCILAWALSSAFAHEEQQGENLRHKATSIVNPFVLGNSEHTTNLRKLQNGRLLSKKDQVYTDEWPVLASAVIQDGSAVGSLDLVPEYAGPGRAVFLVHEAEELALISSMSSLTGLQVEWDLTIQFRLKNLGEEGPNDRDLQGVTTVSGFPCYRDLASTFNLIDSIVAAYPTLATKIDIGDSYLKTQNQGGYDMVVLKITAPNDAPKAPFFAMFGIHAREMAPPELGMRFAETLVQGYGEDADITAILEHTEVHLLLATNPDGRYVAETQQNLLRRKNMRPGGDCGAGDFGVDLNRNFPFKYGLSAGSSTNPCAQTYRGASGGSEPEIQAVTNYALSIFLEDQRKADPEGSDLSTAYPDSTVGMFMDIHSYSQLNIYPWGWVQEASGNNEEMKAAAIKFRHFNGYTVSGPLDPDFLYIVSGASDDWAYGVLGAAGVCFELGTAFYQDCNTFENSIVPGNMPALLYAAKIAGAPYVLPKGPDVVSLVSTVAVPNDSTASLVISAQVSDVAFLNNGYSSYPTGQQIISGVMVYIDRHPDDDPSPAGILMTGTFTTGTVTAILTLTGTNLLSLLTGPTVGKHILHVQATDSAGTKGPVSSKFFNVCSPSDVDCYSTPAPTDVPTRAPVSAPVCTPVGNSCSTNSACCSGRCKGSGSKKKCL